MGIDSSSTPPPANITSQTSADPAPTPTPGDTATITHGRGVSLVDLMRLPGNALTSLFSAPELVPLTQVSRAAFRTIAPLLPLVGWSTPAPPSVTNDYQHRLVSRLESRSAATRRDAQAWLAQWCQALPEGAQGFATGKALALLEGLDSYKPTLCRQVCEGLVRYRVDLPQPLRELILSPDPHAERLGRSLVQRYSDPMGDSTLEILRANDAVPVSLDGSGQLNVNELCRAWFWAPSQEIREDRVRTVALDLLIFITADITTDTLVDAMARFLRRDPRRGEPGFVDVLALVMSQPAEAGLGDLASPAFVEALVHDRPDDPGLPADVVDAAVARAAALRAEAVAA